MSQRSKTEVNRKTIGATALEPQVIAVCKNVNKSSKCDHFQKPVSITDLVEEINLQQASAKEGMERHIKGKVDNNHATTEVDIQENLKLRDIENTHQDKEMGFFNPLFEFLSEQEEGINALFNWLLEDKMGDLLDYLGTLTPVQELEYLYTNFPETCTQSASIDIVPALQARGWPKVAREWINRKRHWPSPEIVHTIIQEGFHLVVKPPKGGGCSDTMFRLSFSHAEYLLSQQLNDVQRKCYRSLKKYYKVCLQTKPKSLATYHLKTLFLQTCEETRADMWTEENMTTCMMRLLANLFSALSEKYLRHFFIKECNLFDAGNIDNPHLLHSLAVKVEHFMRSPMDFSPRLLPTRRPELELSNRYEQAPSNQENQEGCIKGNLPNNPEGCGEASASQDQWPTRTASTAKDVVRMHGTGEPETDTLQGARFHDLKVIYTNTCAELLTIATEDCTRERLDPLQRSFVEDIRELISEYDVCPEKLMDQFESRWNAAYLRMYFNSEVFTKHSTLVALRNNIKMIKPEMIRRDGFIGSPRDYSLLLPVDSLVNLYRRYKRILRTMEPKQSTPKMEDIPLD